MGSYYHLGVVTAFSVRPQYGGQLDFENYRDQVNEVFDLSLYDLTIEDETVYGDIKEDVLAIHYMDLIEQLRKIFEDDFVGVSNDNDYNLDNYFFARDQLYLKEEGQWGIYVQYEIMSLFSEGKVLAESLNGESKFIRHVFRHCKVVDNVLCGAISSCVY